MATYLAVAGGPASSEPDWHLLLTDAIDVAAARAHWGRIVDELRAGGRWSPNNDHAVARLINAYILYDRASREVFERGAVIPSKKTGVPQYSLHFDVMNRTAALAAQLEAELMLSPRKRGKVPMKAAKVAGGVGPRPL